VAGVAGGGLEEATLAPGRVFPSVQGLRVYPSLTLNTSNANLEVNKNTRKT